MHRCPYCGTESEEEICPQCGSRISDGEAATYSAATENTDGRPREPERVQKPEEVISDAAKTVVKNNRVLLIIGGTVAIIIGLAVLYLMLYCHLQKVFTEITEMLTFIILGVGLLFMGIQEFYRLVSDRKVWGWTEKRLKMHTLTKTGIFLIMLAVLPMVLSIIILGVINGFDYITENYIENYIEDEIFYYNLISSAVLCVLAVIAFIAGQKMQRKINLAFYGTAKRQKGQAPVVTQQMLTEEFGKWLRQKQLYRKYKLEYATFTSASKRYNNGKRGSELTAAKPVVWVKANGNTVKVACGITAFVVVLALVTVYVIVPLFSNMFIISRVSRIELYNYTHDNVEELLGSPYEDESTDYMWVYYSDDYMDIIDEMNELEEKLFTTESDSEFDKLFNKAIELETELETVVYKTITVYFTCDSPNSDNPVYRVYSVWLDADCCLSYTNTEKTVKSYEILEIDNLYSGTSRTSVSVKYEAEFTDGSYVKSYGTAYLSDSSSNYQSGDSIEVTWSDMWGEYSGYATVY